MSPRADYAATITAAADDRRRVPSQDHHPAAGRDGQAGNSQAHPATRTLKTVLPPLPPCGWPAVLYLRWREAA